MTLNFTSNFYLLILTAADYMETCNFTKSSKMIMKEKAFIVTFWDCLMFLKEVDS